MKAEGQRCNWGKVIIRLHRCQQEAYVYCVNVIPEWKIFSLVQQCSKRPMHLMTSDILSWCEPVIVQWKAKCIMKHSHHPCRLEALQSVNITNINLQAIHDNAHTNKVGVSCNCWLYRVCMKSHKKQGVTWQNRSDLVLRPNGLSDWKITRSDRSSD